MNPISAFPNCKVFSKSVTGLFTAMLFALLGATTVQPAIAQGFTDMYNFGMAPNDPVTPQNPGIIAQGTDGNMYSTSPLGGSNNAGAVFKITPGGTLSVIYSFDGIVGSLPYSGLTLGNDGNF